MDGAVVWPERLGDVTRLLDCHVLLVVYDSRETPTCHVILVATYASATRPRVLRVAARAQK